MIGLSKERKIIKQAVEANDPVLIIGPTGVGKTSMIRELARQQERVFRRLNLNGSTGVEEFVGKMTLRAGSNGGTETVWQDGILVDAMRHGHWLLVDEINAALPEILFVLQSLLDDDRYVVLADSDGEVVRPAPEFRFFAAMNPPADYAGTKKLNRALMSRFPVVMQIDSPSVAQLKKIVTHHVPELDPAVNHNVCRLAEHINLSQREGNTEFYCSTRDVISLARLMQTGHDIETAFRLAVLNKTEEYEREAITTLASLYIKIKNKPEPVSEQEKEQRLLKQVSEPLGAAIHKLTQHQYLTVSRQIEQLIYRQLKEEKKVDFAVVERVINGIDNQEEMEKYLDEARCRTFVAKKLEMAYQAIIKEKK